MQDQHIANPELPRVAVFFGGRSPEHDVSIVTGLQVLRSIDTECYVPFPVYVAPDGRWWMGEILRDRQNYMLSPDSLKYCEEVTLDVRAQGRPALIPKKTRFWGRPEPVSFDIALPAFHGEHGENGHFQGLFEAASIPYAGPRALACSVFMDKIATKHVQIGLGIPALPYAVFHRPRDGGTYLDQSIIQERLGDLPFPLCVKPVHLGSSVGVAKAASPEDIQAVLSSIFRLDSQAIAEPFVPNLVEYNVSVASWDGPVRTSAIERPKSTEELLDFKQKYLSSDGKSAGTKAPGQSSEGMLSLSREIDPEINADLESRIRDYAGRLFAALNGTGAPRIDFLCDSQSGELWLNEVNPIPGSFAYFLWEAAAEPLMFTELLSSMLAEARSVHANTGIPPGQDPVPRDARLFKRHA